MRKTPLKSLNKSRQEHNSSVLDGEKVVGTPSLASRSQRSSPARRIKAEGKGIPLADAIQRAEAVAS